MSDATSALLRNPRPRIYRRYVHAARPKKIMKQGITVTPGRPFATVAAGKLTRQELRNPPTITRVEKSTKTSITESQKQRPQDFFQMLLQFWKFWNSRQN